MWFFETDDPNKHKILTDDRAESRLVRNTLPRISLARLIANVAIRTDNGSFYEVDNRYLLTITSNLEPMPQRAAEYLRKIGLFEGEVITLPVAQPVTETPVVTPIPVTNLAPEPSLLPEVEIA